MERGIHVAGDLMSWQLKREVLLVLLGVVVCALSIVVLVLNRDASTEILGVIGLGGGIAIIVNTLPLNGRDEKVHDS
jgi:hypothetical protein